MPDKFHFISYKKKFPYCHLQFIIYNKTISPSTIPKISLKRPSTPPIIPLQMMFRVFNIRCKIIIGFSIHVYVFFTIKIICAAKISAGTVRDIVFQVCVFWLTFVEYNFRSAFLRVLNFNHRKSYNFSIAVYIIVNAR